MKKPIAITVLFLTLACVTPLCRSLSTLALAKGDDFNAAVKVVERFYGVKHKSIPFLARAGNGIIYHSSSLLLNNHGRSAKLETRLKNEFDSKHLFPELAKE